MIAVRLAVTVTAGILVTALCNACSSTSSELRYEAPAPGSPTAELVNAGLGGLVVTIDGKETAAFAHSTLVSPGVHRIAINCLSDAGPAHVMLTGAVEANQKYYVRCIVENSKPGVFLSATPNGGPLPGFEAL